MLVVAIFGLGLFVCGLLWFGGCIVLCLYCILIAVVLVCFLGFGLGGYWFVCWLWFVLAYLLMCCLSRSLCIYLCLLLACFRFGGYLGLLWFAGLMFGGVIVLLGFADSG